ncbi:MAG: A/G-specific adenine glycosylase [Propionibacteriaceae bacterium]|nr:A/G-specific adenine glycosylase [Propionibacteriaceae bacterium]
MPSPPSPDATPTPAAARRVTTAVRDWFADQARDLPWRRPDCSPWGILVSEFMLQQTPVSRVLEPWRRWLERWPTPSALAAEPAGEAIRAWGRLGYPRRALRLHAAAVAIDAEHDGQVPQTLEELRALPGVGAYTAAAVASFAFGQSHPVLDTNVRRVLSRVFTGIEFPTQAPTAAERRLALAVLPRTGAAVWAAGSMELGAVVCTAARPRCDDCPVRTECAWLAAGRPAHDGPPRRGQAYAGTDRQVRGLLLQVLREADEPVPAARLDAVWADAAQRERALTALISEGLAMREGEHLRLPG